MLLKHFPAIYRQGPGGGQGVEPLEKLDKKECFLSIFQRSRGRALAGVRGLSTQENFDKNVCFCSIFQRSKGKDLVGVRGGAPGKF